MTGPTSVLIADDHVLTRVGIRRALEEAGFSVCAETGSGASAVDLAMAERPDACLLDIDMPGALDGLGAAARIAHELPGTTIVMLTVSDDDDDLLAALRAGASGYLLKDISPARLPAALTSALKAEMAIPHALMERVFAELEQRDRRRGMSLRQRNGAALSERERDVADLLADGLSTAAIARMLAIPPVAVRRHISAILTK